MEKTDIELLDRAPQEKNAIKIIGVGGGGGNAVNHMFREGINSVDFILCNTDSQALKNSPIPTHVHMGHNELRPFNHPKWGHQAAEECEPELRSMLNDGTKMTLVIAGMGGGTGNGAAPVIANISKELDILTVGIITLPFKFEGPNKIEQALDGIKKMAKHVDSLIVINNECLWEIYPEMSVLEAFDKADEALYLIAKSLAEVITVHGLINLDINDMKCILTNGGVTFIGIGYGEGENSVRNAIEDAIHSPFLNGNDVFKSKRHLLNITIANEDSSSCLMMEDIHYIDDFQAKFGEEFEIMWGLKIDPKLGRRVKATILATGYDLNIESQHI